MNLSPIDPSACSGVIQSRRATKLTRRAALAMLAGAAMPRLSATADGAPYRLRSYETTYAVPLAMRLDLVIASNGSARVDGTIRVRLGEASGSRILIAQGTGQARVADVDGDGVAGLTRLEADFRDAASGSRVGVVLFPAGPDIDASGDYEVTIVIGKEALTGLTAARIGAARRVRRR